MRPWSLPHRWICLWRNSIFHLVGLHSQSISCSQSDSFVHWRSCNHLQQASYILHNLHYQPEIIRSEFFPPNLLVYYLIAIITDWLFFNHEISSFNFIKAGTTLSANKSRTLFSESFFRLNSCPWKLFS